MTGNTLPVRSRSISGVGASAACELFCIPGLDATFAAHESGDGSIFVQQLDVRSAAAVMLYCSPLGDVFTT
jgi:hypothetical protein